MKLSSNKSNTTPVFSGVGMLVWEVKSAIWLRTRNHRESTDGRDEIAMG